MKKIVVYTAIFGGCDDLRDPKFVPDNCDFVCFSEVSSQKMLAFTPKA